MYRSRLQSLESRRNIRSIFLLSVGAVILFVVLIMFGMPILTRLAILLSNLRSSSRDVAKTDIIPPAPPQIIRSYDATNSAKQTLSGYAEVGTTVYLTQNNQAKGNLVVADDSKFHFDVTLDLGDNIFQAVAIDQAGNKSFASPEYKLEYSNKSPKLSIDTLSDGKILRGNVENATSLTIDDRLIAIKNDGKFEAVLNLPEGEHTIDVVAMDKYGNQTKRQVTVTTKP